MMRRIIGEARASRWVGTRGRRILHTSAWSMIAKAAAATIDDVGVAAAKAGSKAAGVVIDDAAVTPSYVTEFTPDRELPIIKKIALGSLKNKLLILLPAALLLSEFLPAAVTPLLMLW